jgi:hypothetical protein
MRRGSSTRSSGEEGLGRRPGVVGEDVDPEGTRDLGEQRPRPAEISDAERLAAQFNPQCAPMSFCHLLTVRSARVAERFRPQASSMATAYSAAEATSLCGVLTTTTRRLVASATSTLPTLTPAPHHLKVSRGPQDLRRDVPRPGRR